ncbi:enoyl-CoA hydratase-like protein [Sarcoptes scabiei]|uniref:Ethylmalonyl-CoA decarboxylase n=1 Tax=Sarcoptes scabiei TaxID=52283 RepID=A0A132AFE7_SARSC|nr:enoyl-CoA hydratase-like protein [Sarcoptes scabiei]
MSSLSPIEKSNSIVKRIEEESNIESDCSRDECDIKHKKIDEINTKESVLSLRNGDPKEELSLHHIRERLRQCDPNCNGHLTLKLDDETGIGLLCIQSPQRRNAFSGYMMAQFSDLLDQLESWKKLGAKHISTLMHSNLKRLEELPIISIAMIEGKALGGGAEIITACDFRVAAANAHIGFVHARLGVTPGFGGGTRLQQLLGPTESLKLMLSARLIGAQEAQRIGLVQHVLPENLKGDAALKATIDWYKTNYGLISSSASQAIKNIVSVGKQNISKEQALINEARIFCSVWGSEEHKNALASKIKHYE